MHNANGPFRSRHVAIRTARRQYSRRGTLAREKAHTSATAESQGHTSRRRAGDCRRCVSVPRAQPRARRRLSDALSEKAVSTLVGGHTVVHTRRDGRPQLSPLTHSARTCDESCPARRARAARERERGHEKRARAASPSTSTKVAVAGNPATLLSDRDLAPRRSRDLTAWRRSRR